MKATFEGCVGQRVISGNSFRATHEPMLMEMGQYVTIWDDHRELRNDQC